MSVRGMVSRKQAWIVCRRQRLRFFKKAARRKYIVVRGLSMILVLGTFIYLAAVVRWKDRLFQVRENYTVEFERTEIKGQDNLITEFYGVILRMKSGELEVYHSRNSMEEAIP